MLKRLWFLLAGVWAAVFLCNGLTKLNGVGAGDLMLAFAPLVFGWLLARGARFVVTGSPVRTRTIPYRAPGTRAGR